MSLPEGWSPYHYLGKKTRYRIDSPGYRIYKMPVDGGYQYQLWDSKNPLGVPQDDLAKVVEHWKQLNAKG